MSETEHAKWMLALNALEGAEQTIVRVAQGIMDQMPIDKLMSILAEGQKRLTWDLRQIQQITEKKPE